MCDDARNGDGKRACVLRRRGCDGSREIQPPRSLVDTTTTRRNIGGAHLQHIRGASPAPSRESTLHPAQRLGAGRSRTSRGLPRKSGAANSAPNPLGLSHTDARRSGTAIMVTSVACRPVIARTDYSLLECLRPVDRVGQSPFCRSHRADDGLTMEWTSAKKTRQTSGLRR